MTSPFDRWVLPIIVALIVAFFFGGAELAEHYLFAGAGQTYNAYDELQGNSQ